MAEREGGSRGWLVLVRPQRIRVHRPRALLADRARDGARPLVRARGAIDRSRVATPRRAAPPARDVPRLLWRYCGLLLRRLRLRQAHEPRDRGVLALVG